MENTNATTYTPAKNKTGCKAPIGVKVLDFMLNRFLVFKRLDLTIFSSTS